MLVICEHCGNDFERRDGEVNRSRRLDRAQYCTQSCATKGARTKGGSQGSPGWKGHGRKADELSPFREYLRRMRKRNHEVDVTLIYLKQSWEEQGGRCALSGMSLELAESTHKRSQVGNPYAASVDRIDSSRGYVVGNIQWVAVIANFCKNGWTDQEVIEFARVVVQKHGMGDLAVRLPTAPL